MKIILILPLIYLFFNCYGPALSEQYVCKDEKMKEGPNAYDCLLIYQLKKNPTEEDRNLFALCTKVLDDKCKDKSKSKPWWL